MEFFVDFLLQLNSDFETPNRNGATPLMISCLSHQTGSQIFNKVLQYSMETINQQDYQGYTALHYAAMSNNGFLVKKLLSVSFCDPNIRNHEGQNFIQVSQNQPKMIALLQQRNNSLAEEKKISQKQRSSLKRKRISIRS
jgi:ankyrin repeat protein